MQFFIVSQAAQSSGWSLVPTRGCLPCSILAPRRSTCRLLSAMIRPNPARITVGYGDRTPKKAGFSKEGTFGQSFGRVPKGKASNRSPAGLRPAGASLLRTRPRLGPKVPSSISLRCPSDFLQFPLGTPYQLPFNPIRSPTASLGYPLPFSCDFH